MSDLPRLLLCSFDVIPGPSGSSRRVTEYLKALPDRFSVVVLSAKTPDHSHIEKYQGARLLRVPVGSGDLASRIQAFERAVRRQLESEEYALAHFTDPFGGYALCERKADFGYRLIYEAQTFPSQELRYTHPQTEGDRRFLSKIRRQELFCLMNADLIVTGSQTTRAYIQSLGASEELIRVVRAPVDLKPYTPDVLGAPDGEPLRMMYLGSQVGWQGLSTLLRAVAHAARQVPVRLTVVGAQHPDWQPHLDDLVKELGLKEQVEFQPPVQHDDLAKVLALADVGVLPLDDVERNRLQGGPLAKVSEYFAAGRPVIAADLPVTRELIPEDAALFFPPGDIVALALSIIELARDLPRRAELGRRARAHAERVLDAGLIRGQLLDLYDSLLEKRSERAASTSEEDLPAPTTVTGTPTNRLAALLPPEGARAQPPAPEARTGQPPEALADAAAPREDLPLVMGHALEEGLDTRLVKTEPDVKPTEPPVVMGLPLREPSPSPSGTEAVGGSPAVSGRTDAGPGKESPLPSLAEAPPTPAPTVRAPSVEEPAAGRSQEPQGREEPSQGREEPPAPTPIVRGPGAPEREEPPAPTPVVRGPGAPERRESSTSVPSVRGPGEPERREAPGPVVRNPAELERKESSTSSPVVRGPGEPERRESSTSVPAVRGPAEPERKGLATPALPVSAEVEATPAPTPIVRAPILEGEEPPAPTPIVRVPAALLSDEPPAPTPIVPARAVFASRSTSTRMETPVARTTALPSSPRAETPSGRTPSVGTGSRPALSSQPPPVLRPSAPPDADRPPIRGGLPSADRQPGPPPRAAAPPPVPPRQRPPRLTPDGPPRLDPVGVTGSRPALPSSLKGPAHPEDEPEEISEDEAQAIEEGDSGTTPPHSRPHVDEPDEISSDEVEEAEISATSAARLIEDDEELQDAEPTPANASQPVDEGPAPEPIPSSLNPWFAQLAHGYCPPEGIRFDRHTPPTTFPGRDDGTDPARLPAASRAQGVVRGKSS